MENQDRINNLVNVARHHIEYAIEAIQEAENFSLSTRYIHDLLRQSYSNLSMSQHYLNVANDITESISV